MGTATRKIANAFSTSGVISSANINNASLDNITTISGAGDMILVSSATASSSASIEFTLGNYKEYKFFFVNIHPSVDCASLNFNMSTDNGSNYNVTKTTTLFYAFHREDGTNGTLSYIAGDDQAQSTAFQQIIRQIGTDNDQSGSGYMHLFNPSSTTYVKHFMSNTNLTQCDEYQEQIFCAGYANTTSALTNIRFQMSSGNIDAGTILMYGKN